MSDDYQPAKVAVAAELVGHKYHQKQGHSCCGCCCDTRRAVIIVNIIMLCFTTLSAILIIGGVELMKGTIKTLGDDDQVQQATKEIDDLPVGLLVAMVMIQAVFFVFGIMGAINYTKWMVIVALIGYALALVGNILTLSIFGIVLSAAFAYPHFFFLREMSQGIMTPDNYPNEVQSCCCV